MGRAIDETGNIYGDLLVLKKSDYLKRRYSAYWVCRCKCGRMEDICGEDLRSGKRTECKYCRSFKKNGFKTGDRIGKLTILKPFRFKQMSNRTRFTILCECDCGNLKEVRADHLKNGQVQSCGRCMASKNEYKISYILKENNIPFIEQKSYKNYRFDFYVNNKYMIEFDGEQHFMYKGGWFTEDRFNTIHQNDLIKNKYCFDNNIPLIRIPYDAEYDLNDLKLETTRFLLTPENEEEYYKSRITK